MENKKLISIVIPCYNEEKNIDKTIDEIIEVEKTLEKYKFEIIAVNDGSKDDTWKVIKKYSQKYDNVIGINQMTNFGQSMAYQAGFDVSNGEYLITVSADLEIPLENLTKVIEKLEEGYDLVNTNRVGRWGGDDLSGEGKDRAMKSGYANRLIKKISGMDIQDRGSGMKGLTKPLYKNLKFYGEMHRFIPDYVSVYGAKIIEFDVNYKEREYGESYYKGHKRTVKVLLDLTTLVFMLYFARKPFNMMPGRLFGFTGAVMGALGFFITSFLVLEKFVMGTDIGTRPLFLLGALMMLLGIIMVMLGMLGELLMRTYFESTGRKPYMSREIARKSI